MSPVLFILYIIKNILVINGNNVPEKSINWALASRTAEHLLPMYQAGIENNVLPESILTFGKLVRSHDELVIVILNTTD